MSAIVAARSTLAFAAAATLSLALAGATFALSWSAPQRIGPDRGSYVYVGDVCTANGHPVAVFSNFTDVVVSRSNDGGATFARSRIYRDEGAGLPVLACRGSKVDLVWGRGSAVRYAHSVDAGTSFSRSVRLSPVTDDVTGMDVAHGSNSVVVVAWEDMNTDGFPDDVWVRIRVRVSRDGGVTFGSVRTLVMGDVTSLAVTDDAIYVAYRPDEEPARAVIVRSTDFGATWSAPVTIATRPGPMTIAAIGGRVLAAYVRAGSSGYSAWYRQSIDGGTSWSIPVQLAPAGERQIDHVDMSVDAGVTRVVFDRVTDKLNNRISYRESSDGLSWSAREIVAYGGAPSVTYAGRALVMYGAMLPGGTKVRSFISFRAP